MMERAVAHLFNETLLNWLLRVLVVLLGNLDDGQHVDHHLRETMASQ